MKPIRSVLPLTSLLGLLAAPFLQAANWPQFRGPSASGIDASAEAPVAWDVTTRSNVLWKTPIAGMAHAAPIVWGDRVYVLTAASGKQDKELKVGLYGDIESVDEKAEYAWHLLALDRKDGRIVWDTVAHKGIPKVKRHTKATHANSTPATDGRRIVTILGSEGLFCFDMDGKPLWRKDLGPMDSGYYEVKSAQWGFASSPVIDGNRVYVQCDVQKDSYLAAFDLETGRELWKASRDEVPTWGTPTVVEHAGRRQVVVNGWHHLGGYDPETGKELWRLREGGDIPVPTPIFGDGLIYLTSAHGKLRPMRAVRADASGNVTPAEPAQTNAAIAWVHPRQGAYMQTPILVGGNLYSCFDIGLLTCFDAQSGVIRFSERLAPSGRGWTSSPVSDGKHLYFTSEEGEVAVVKATGRFEVAATNRLEETHLSTPALSGGVLYFRTRGHLLAIGSR